MIAGGGRGVAFACRFVGRFTRVIRAYRRRGFGGEPYSSSEASRGEVVEGTPSRHIRAMLMMGFEGQKRGIGDETMRRRCRWSNSDGVYTIHV